MTASGTLPVLSEDRSRFDWSRAAYEPDVRVFAEHAIVTHRLRDADALQRLLTGGLARWAVEVRSPKTLHGSVLTTDGGRQRVEWAHDETHGDLYLIPGLVAVAEFDLQPEPGELTRIWDDARCHVRPGWWLARGTPRRTRSLGQSLLKFAQDADLADGRMRIQRDQSDDDLHFHVHLAKDIWPRRTVRDVQLAALIGALGQMPGAYDDPKSEPAVVRELRDRLDTENVATWTDHDEYDPALAATAIERFIVPESADD